MDRFPLKAGLLRFADQIGTTMLDLVFPPHCVHCERVGTHLCSHCQSSIQVAPRRQCPDLDALHVYAVFEGAMRSAIHGLKYERQTRLVPVLGQLMLETFGSQEWSVDLTTAVPLHPNRLRERGYNQAALLGEHVATVGGWSFVGEAIVRLRETQSQTRLNALERQANVVGAFEADAALVNGKRVLLVDDVLTTGATLGACAVALRAAGAAWVGGIALAAAAGVGDDARPLVDGASVL
jgi:ComF family protein